MRIIILLVATAMAGACASTPDLEVSTQAVDEWDPSDPCPECDGCPPPGCAGNSPVVDGIFFGLLNLDEQPNMHGVRVTGAFRPYPNYGPVTLEVVDGDRLRAVTPAPSSVVLEHEDLEGVMIQVTVNNGPTQTIQIGRVESETFWAREALSVETYELSYHAGNNIESTHLCSEGDGDPTKISAVVFTGDLYNPMNLNITVGSSTQGWINIACSGSAIYKMHMMGHTTAATARLGITRTVAQRRAMLNAWTAHVCGGGEVFTIPGERITLRESQNAILSPSPYLDTPDTYEAIWNEDGAVCLDVPRLADSDAQILDHIESACGSLPPSCTGMLSHWTSYGHVLTGNLDP